MEPDAAMPAWSLYFAGECEPGDPRLPVIRALQSFFASNLATYINKVEAVQLGRVTLDYTIMRETIPVGDFASVLKDEPSTVLSCLAIAIHQALLADDAALHALPRLSVRLANYKPVLPLKDLKSNAVDKFVAFKGNVVRVSGIRPVVTSMEFECTKCGNRARRAFTDFKYDPPNMCEGSCKNRTFAPDRKSATTIDWQQIRLQEILGGSHVDQGRIPRTMELELTRDLVDCCIPGDVITVAGTVKARKTEVKGGGGKKSLFVLYLDVNSVSNGNQNENGKLEAFAFGPRDCQAIIEIAQQPELFKFLVHSLCPSIYGHELVKAGLLLALFGGCQKNANDKGKIAVRGDPHVLVVGDPGLGKSQMLRAVSTVAPRGVYVCGNTTSTSGLTVTMVRDAGSEFALEAGALVLADQGACCIDEFDKMGSEHNALLEAMEQQSISIAKAGIVCSLSARTSVIAAANPVGGHYDKARTVAENLKMGWPLLSRFDVIFILLDKPDEARDQLLSEHVIKLHAGVFAAGPGRTSARLATPASEREGAPLRFGACRSPFLSQRSQQAGAAADAADGSSQQSMLRQWSRARPLAQRLRLGAEEQQALDALPPQLMRKYIAYARKYVRPRLSGDAKKVLRDFYLQLRRDNQGKDGTPVTTRQLESMIRLAEARAKAELRETVTGEDAADVVDIMKESLLDLFSDQHGHLDFRRSRGMSKSKQVSAFTKALHRAAEARQDALFSLTDLQEVARDINLGVERFDDFVEMLNEQGFLLRKGGRKFALCSSSYSTQ